MARARAQGEPRSVLRLADETVLVVAVVALHAATELAGTEFTALADLGAGGQWGRRGPRLAFRAGEQQQATEQKRAARCLEPIHAQKPYAVNPPSTARH